MVIFQLKVENWKKLKEEGLKIYASRILFAFFRESIGLPELPLPQLQPSRLLPRSHWPERVHTVFLNYPGAGQLLV